MLEKSETEGKLDGFSDGMLVGKVDKVGKVDTILDGIVVCSLDTVGDRDRIFDGKSDGRFDRTFDG